MNIESLFHFHRCPTINRIEGYRALPDLQFQFRTRTQPKLIADSLRQYHPPCTIDLEFCFHAIYITKWHFICQIQR